MSFYRYYWVVVVAVGLVVLCCDKDSRQPTIETPISNDQQRDRSQKDNPPLKHLPPQPTTEGAENPRTADPVDSEDFFSAGMSRQRKKDYKGAIELFERACAEGQGAACYQLGVMFRDGVGVAVSEHRAQSWFQLACQKDNVAACDALGH